MNHNGKEFTPISGCDDYYICKETTEVLSLKSAIPFVLSQVHNSSKASCNYYVVAIRNKKEGKGRNMFIHRLMCETFLPNPENKPMVNHKDGNKLNNKLNNLEWVTAAENNKHAIDTGLSNPGEHTRKDIHQYSLGGNYINSFISDAEAERVTGVTRQNISKVSLGLRDHAGGFMWSREKVESMDPLPYKVPECFVVEDMTTGDKSEHPYSGGDIAEKLGLHRDYIKVKFNKSDKDYILHGDYKITITYKE